VPVAGEIIAGVELSLAARAVEVTKVFGKGETAVRAVDGISVDFPSRQLTAVMGPSGSAKSTLLLIFVATAAVAGVLAAIFPGMRAARIDILRAITTE
jgi:ABC-type glutathione transport system ATPase component